MHVFIGNAPDGSAGSREEKLLDRYSKTIDSKKIWNIVMALNEFGIREQKRHNPSKIQYSETQRPDEHRGDQVVPEKSNDQNAHREGNDRVVDGLARMPELKHDKNYDDDERRQVAFARGFSDDRKFFFQKDLRYH